MCLGGGFVSRLLLCIGDTFFFPVVYFWLWEGIVFATCLADHAGVRVSILPVLACLL